MNAASKSTWGRRPERTADELFAIYTDFMSRVKVPEKWKYMGDAPVICEGVTISVGKVFRDMRTRGYAIMHYKITFVTYAERLAIVERSLDNDGKSYYKTVVSNKTPEQLNEFIQQKYKHIDRCNWWKMKRIKRNPRPLKGRNKYNII